MQNNLNHNEYYTAEYYENKQSLPLSLVNTLDLFFRKHNVSCVIEIGCGSGFLLRALKTKGYAAYGCDISFYAARQAEQINAGAVQLPFKDGSADAVIAISMIEHLTLEDTRSFLKEARRIITNKGIIFLVTPNKASLKSFIFGYEKMHTADPSHIYFYSPNSLSRELKKAKFTNIRCLFPSPKNCSLTGWSIPKIIQNTNVSCVKNMVNWLLISSFLGLIRDSFWICGQKPTQENNAKQPNKRAF